MVIHEKSKQFVGPSAQGVSDPGHRFSINISNIGNIALGRGVLPISYGARQGAPAANIQPSMSTRQARNSFNICTFTQILQSSAADTD